MGSVIVLDLDETLIFAIARDETVAKKDALLWKALCNAAEKKCRARGLDCIHSDSHFIYLRPHAIPFVRFCREEFPLLIVFTAANQAHAETINRELFQTRANVSIDFLLHRENCGKSSANLNLTNLIPFQKNLCHLREIVEKNLSDEKRMLLRWEDCIFVDDYSLHAVNNCGEMLLIPKFDYPCLKDLLVSSADKVLLTEAACDDTLQNLIEFIAAKKSMKPQVYWHNLDKRFAMFQKKIIV